MAWTEMDRDALKEAIASGEKSVAYTDRRVEYRSLVEMRQILALMEEELSPVGRRRRTYMSCSDGVKI
jgi:hypothetical protein